MGKHYPRSDIKNSKISFGVLHFVVRCLWLTQSSTPRGDSSSRMDAHEPTGPDWRHTHRRDRRLDLKTACEMEKNIRIYEFNDMSIRKV